VEILRLRPPKTDCLASALSALKPAVGALAARLYRRLYRELCGAHPDLRPWHFQWLSGSILYKSLREQLPTLRGRVLDVGCGDKPYETWMSGATSYVGIDVSAGPGVDAVIEPHQPWPVADEDFDAVLCTQVLEHVAEGDRLLMEATRVLKPGGTLLVTVPFAYGEHAWPHDYWRFSRQGAREAIGARLRVVETIPQGGIGSTLGAMLLAWLELTFTRSGYRVLLLTALLPVWMGVALLVNGVGRLLDAVDRTGAFYGNVMLLATKPHDDPSPLTS
jgi:SAM-dependent methyltransferase